MKSQQKISQFANKNYLFFIIKIIILHYSRVINKLRKDNNKVTSINSFTIEKKTIKFVFFSIVKEF